MNKKILLVSVFVVAAVGGAAWLGAFSVENDSKPQKTQTNVNPSKAGKVREINMIAKKWQFKPSTITVEKGKTVRLKITSQDVMHGLAIPELGINQQLPPGETKTVEFTANKKGKFNFACSVYCGRGHGRMTGRIIVE
ncbi:MAG: cupredoxin domain-containing protein [Candidatus Magasanikbacteria bacterium]